MRNRGGACLVSTFHLVALNRQCPIAAGTSLNVDERGRERCGSTYKDDSVQIDAAYALGDPRAPSEILGTFSTGDEDAAGGGGATLRIEHRLSAGVYPLDAAAEDSGAGRVLRDARRVAA